MDLTCRLASFGSAAALLALVGSAGCGAAAEPPPRSPSAGDVASTAEARPAEHPATAEAATAANPGAPLLSFIGIGRGDHVADLGTGGGYPIEPFANAVGPFGVVYVRHNPKLLHDLPSDAVRTAPAESVPANVIHMPTTLDSPFLPAIESLDCATLLFGYHELIAEQRDRKLFNKTVFRVLKPGGLYIIADHSGGAAATSASNRVDARLVQAEVEAAGFRFVEAADFLSLSLQARAAAAQRPAQTSQYILKFQKPGSR